MLRKLDGGAVRRAQQAEVLWSFALMLSEMYPTEMIVMKGDILIQEGPVRELYKVVCEEIGVMWKTR